MAETSREWKQPAQQLWHLFVVDKGSECKDSNANDPEPELDTVGEFDVENRSRSKTVCSKQVDKVCRSQVKVDMLQTE